MALLNQIVFCVYFLPCAKYHIAAKLNDINLNKAAKDAPMAARPGVQFGGNFKNSPLSAKTNRELVN